MNRTIICTALFSVLLLTGCQSKEKKETDNHKSVKVTLMPVSSNSTCNSSCFSGTVEEENGTALSFSVSGTINRIYIRMGQQVEKGTLIATLEPSSLRSSYNLAKASLEQAEDAYRRMKVLYDKGSLPEIKWVEVQSQLQQARSMEEIAGKNLNDCNLYAPFSGVISEKTAEVGQNIMPEMQVAKLVTARLLKVKIAVPETEIADIRLSQQARIVVPALGDKTFTGTVVEKGVVANSFSRSYDVKIRPEDVGSELMPGMIAEVYLNHEKTTSTECVVPANIIQLDEKNNSFVWIEQSGKACKRIIECGEFTAEGVTIVSGLTGDERLIVEGQQKICEGTLLSF